MNRKIAILVWAASLIVPTAALLDLGHLTYQPTKTAVPHNAKSKEGQNQADKEKEGQAKIHYLEIVTTDVDAACKLYSKMFGVTFGDPVQKFGGARTAKLEGGGMLAVRGPLRQTEKPVVRPYFLVKDINQAVAAAKKAGAVVAMPPTPIPDEGQFSIIIQGGIESGLWQKR